MNHYSNKSVQHFYHIINLLEAMADKGVKISLIIEKCEDKIEITHPNINVICQRKKGISRGIELFQILRKLISEGYSKIFIRISINAALVSIITSKFFGGETYYWQSGTTLEIDKQNILIKKIKWYFFSYSKLWLIKTFVNHFVTGPETMIKYYIDSLKIDSRKMLMLYNDIDISRFSSITKEQKEQLRTELGFSNDEKIILMVHRLSPVRKTDKYIPAVLEDQRIIDLNAKLLIVGEGPERKKLEEEIDKSIIKDRIVFLGAKPNNIIEQYYKISDVFINPSYTEGFPRVILEAMSCGLPIVATDAGGTIDIFGELQKDFVVDKENVSLFRKMLIKLLLDNNLREVLGNENLKYVERFSTDSVSEMYIERIFNNGEIITR